VDSFMIDRVLNKDSDSLKEEEEEMHANSLILFISSE